MESDMGNRASSVEDGEIHPSPGHNGGGASSSNGINLSSVEKEIEETRMRLRRLEDLKQHELPGATAAAAYHEVPAAAETEWDKSEVDARSIFVGNVDYACLPEEVQLHFQECGTINRVTILTDSFGHPKGYAYVEFLEVEAVQKALLLNDTELHDRRLKVSQKRTNVPGMSHPRGRRPHDPYSYPTYGMVPRFRRPPRYWPY